MIGIMVDEISNTQLGLGLLNLDHKGVIIYTAEQKTTILPMCPIMSELDAYSHTGPLICSSLKTLSTAIKFPRVKLYWYVWSFEWFIYQSNSSKSKLQILSNPKIDIICRSKHHANIITKLFKTPIGIVEEFDYEQLIKTIQI